MNTLEELDSLNDTAPIEPGERPEGAPDLASLDALNTDPPAQTARPQPVYANDGTVYVRDTFTGRVGVVSPDKLGALGQGVQLATLDEIQADLDRREYGDLGSQVAAGLEGTAQGLTLGAYGLAAGAVSPEYRQEMAKRAEYNPVTEGIGQAVGAIAPVVLSGGTGAVAKAAAYAPTALIERAGVAAGEAALARLGGQAAGVGARVAAKAVQGAVEGGLQNAGMATTAVLPQALQDPTKAAEHVLAAGAEGLFIGGAMGTVLGGLGEGLGAAGRKLDARVATAEAEATERAAKQPASAVDETNFGQVTADLEVKPLVSRELSEPVRGVVQRFQDQAHAAETFETAQQVGTRDVRKLMDVALKDLDQIDETASIAAKAQEIARLNNGYGRAIATDDIDNVVGRISDELRVLRSADGAGEAALQDSGGLSAVSKVQSAIKHAQGKYRKALADGNAGDAFMELDNLKRTLGKAARTQNTVAQPYLRAQYESLRSFLEDTSVWGELGDIQKAVNASWGERISRQMDQRVQGFFVRSGEKAFDPFESLRLSNDRAIGSLLNQLGDAESEGTEEAFRLMLRSMAKDATNRAQAWGTGELRDKAVNIVRSVTEIERIMDSTALLRRDALAATRAASGSKVLDAASAIAGTFAPGVGFAVKVAGGFKQAAAQALAEAATGTEQRITKAAANLVRGAQRGVQTAGRVAPLTTGALSEKKYQAAVQEATELSDPTSDASAALEARHTELAQVSPALADAYAQTTLARSQFIASKLPVQRSTAVFAPAPALDPGSERRLRRYVAAAYAPAAAIDRVAAGIGSPEDVETVRTLYPRMYGQFVEETKTRLQQSRKAPDPATRRRIHMATGIETDPTVNPKSVGLYQQIAQGGGGPPRQTQPRSFRMPRDPNKQYGSRVDAIIDRG